jgi:hypothetical protein
MLVRLAELALAQLPHADRRFPPLDERAVAPASYCAEHPTSHLPCRRDLLQRRAVLSRLTFQWVGVNCASPRINLCAGV